MASMVSYVTSAIEAAPIKRFRIGIADGDALELAALLRARVERLPRVEDISTYTIGPAVGAHTGPGCTGVVFLGRPM
jgi:fatty acid-binding protein DegV